MQVGCRGEGGRSGETAQCEKGPSGRRLGAADPKARGTPMPENDDARANYLAGAACFAMIMCDTLP